MRKPIVGVFGPGEGATADDCKRAYELGVEIAKNDWILLTGGRNVGVMDAACQGARLVGGLTIGVLAGADLQGASDAVEIAFAPAWAAPANNLNALSCDGIIACGVGWGTISEVALGLKAGKPVVLLNWEAALAGSFVTLAPERVAIADSSVGAIACLRSIAAL